MELKEKWNLKEGWCWNDDVNEAQECLMLHRVIKYDHSYFCKIDGNDITWFENFSETDPNQEELKVGEFAYFWDDGDLERSTFMFSKLTEIDNDRYKYGTNTGNYYEHCSHTNPLLK